MSGFDLLLPWPPTGNLNVRHTLTGRHYLTKKTTDFRKAVWYAVRERNIKPLPGRLSLQVVVSPPDRRQRDLDNLVKPLADALQAAGAFVNDSAIDYLEVRRGDVVPGGSVFVVMMTMEGK